MTAATSEELPEGDEEKTQESEETEESPGKFYFPMFFAVLTCAGLSDSAYFMYSGTMSLLPFMC